jgi:putative phosphoesterase
LVLKLALLGDVHGNADALSAVLAAAQDMGVEHLLVTGDLVGYYFAPAKVLELLAPWSRHTVRGNHEDMLAASRSDQATLDSIRSRYGSGIQVALEQLSDSQLNEVCSLPHPLQLDIDGCRILLCHGAPWNVDQYVYPDATPELLHRCVGPGIDFVVLGHTHYPMTREIGHVQIVNPGSVGQPRNRQPGAQWVFLDTNSRRLEFRVEQYDKAPLIRECRLRHPELPYLAEILERM